MLKIWTLDALTCGFTGSYLVIGRRGGLRSSSVLVVRSRSRQAFRCLVKFLARSIECWSKMAFSTMGTVPIPTICLLSQMRCLIRRIRNVTLFIGSWGRYDLKIATPNRGYKIAAALLCEGVISTVVTLNFDLALSTALGELGAGKIVAIVERPEDLPRQRGINVYYLHRNANAADPELWVLRTASLTTEWREGWEAIIATRVLAAPVVVFAGLGTPVSVLVESTKLLRSALPGTTSLYQADPGEREDSRFAAELEIGPANYIQLGLGGPNGATRASRFCGAGRRGPGGSDAQGQ